MLMTGKEIIEQALARAIKADPADVPIGLDPSEAAIWHAAQASAFQYALEMWD